ncbi:hypothetical protein C8R43DRAFT_17157 [Mycena crocata]|nr:hypothetical protein C8R43DRAFT_17157 [Mycena crocata]
MRLAGSIYEAPPSRQVLHYSSSKVLWLVPSCFSTSLSILSFFLSFYSTFYFIFWSYFSLGFPAMQIPFSVLFAFLLSLDVFAVPVPNAEAGNDFGLQVRAAKKAKAPVVKVKPVKAAKPVKVKPVAKPAAKTTGKPASKEKATPTDKKTGAKSAVAKTPTKSAKIKASAKVSAKPSKASGKAVKPSASAKASGATCAVKKPAVKAKSKARAFFDYLFARGTVKTAKPKGPARTKTSKKVPSKKPLKGITACGVVIRNDGVASICKAKGSAFLFIDGQLSPSLAQRASDSGSDVSSDLSDDAESEEPDDSQDGDFSPDPEPENRSECDHVLELQVLKKAFEASGGVCAALDAMIASPNSGLSAADKVAFMAPVIQAINGKNNLFFLDKKLNQVKRDQVTASLKGQAAKASVSTDLSDQRVGINEYLTNKSVNGPSITLAKNLDKLASEMLTKAEVKALTNIKSCGGATAAADEKALKAAKAKFKASTSVSSAWANVLKHVAAQALI